MDLLTADEEITYHFFYDKILSFVKTQHPSNIDTIEFLGALLFSLLDTVEVNENERKFYKKIYTKLIMEKLGDEEIAS